MTPRELASADRPVEPADPQRDTCFQFRTGIVRFTAAHLLGADGRSTSQVPIRHRTVCASHRGPAVDGDAIAPWATKHCESRLVAGDRAIMAWQATPTPAPVIERGVSGVTVVAGRVVGVPGA
jgi:hypothetical protein